MLAADVVVSETGALLDGERQRGAQVVGDGQGGGRVVTGVHGSAELALEVVGRDLKRGQDLDCQVALLLQDAEQEVLGADGVVACCDRGLSTQDQRVAGPVIPPSAPMGL